MLKILLLVFMFSFLFLYGCTEESEQAKEKQIISNDVNEETLNTPEYVNVRIIEIENGNITIGPPATDPEASYPAYKVFIEENTIVEGEKTALNELREGDHVSVWTKLEGSEMEIVEKIVVSK